MNILKSIGVILLALIVITLLSSLTDFALEKSGMMALPFDSNPLGVKLFVVLYRTIYVAIGAYITAWLSPVRPTTLLWILAGIGTLMGIGGAVVMWHEPPHWYPISLIILGAPAVWFGGRLRLNKRAG